MYRTISNWRLTAKIAIKNNKTWHETEPNLQHKTNRSAHLTNIADIGVKKDGNSKCKKGNQDGPPNQEGQGCKTRISFELHPDLIVNADVEAYNSDTLDLASDQLVILESW